VCDPLCGSGAIPIECAIEWPCSFNISGDNFHCAPPRTQDNVNYVNNQRSLENKYGYFVFHMFRQKFLLLNKTLLYHDIVLANMSYWLSPALNLSQLNL
jgi:hypothetical protein